MSGIYPVIFALIDKGDHLIADEVKFESAVRIAAGAAQGLDIGQAGELIGFLLGGGVAAASHATKAGTRVMINTSPEPVSNWTASIGEDLAVIGGVWAALNHPYIFLALLVLFVLLMAWLLPRLWRGVKAVFSRLAALFSRKPPVLPPLPGPDNAKGGRQ